MLLQYLLKICVLSLEKRIFNSRLRIKDKSTKRDNNKDKIILKNSRGLDKKRFSFLLILKKIQKAKKCHQRATAK